MNSFEYGFFDELEKIAGPGKGAAALAAALFAGSVGLQGVKGLMTPTSAEARRNLAEFVAKNSQGARTGYGYHIPGVSRAAAAKYRGPAGAPAIRGATTPDDLRAASATGRAAAAGRGLPTSPGQYSETYRRVNVPSGIGATRLDVNQ